jgi:hypothetical protein
MGFNRYVNRILVPENIESIERIGGPVTKKMRLK